MSTKRIVFLLGLVGLVVGLVGCKTFTTPTGVLEVALGALQENNMERFRSTLYGTALEEYGNPQGMQQVRQRLSAYVQFATGDSVQTSRESIGPKKWLTTHTVEVLGSAVENEEPRVLVGTATVLCWNERTTVRGSKGRPIQTRKVACRISDF